MSLSAVKVGDRLLVIWPRKPVSIRWVHKITQDFVIDDKGQSWNKHQGSELDAKDFGVPYAKQAVEKDLARVELENTIRLINNWTSRTKNMQTVPIEDLKKIVSILRKAFLKDLTEPSCP